MPLFRYDNLKVSIDNDDCLERILAAKMNVDVQSIRDARCVRRSIDARDKKNICLVYSYEFILDGKLRRIPKGANLVSQILQPVIAVGAKRVTHRPIVVGFGPAGIFTALTLAKYGYRPLVFERGSSVDGRAVKVGEFWSSGRLDVNCNVQFGEGGAGTFSDGKLTCRSNDPLVKDILKEFIECGASQEILYSYKPHIGTDVLRTVVRNLREKALCYGAEIRFDCGVDSLIMDSGRICGIEASGSAVATQAVFLASGHSARDVFEHLHAVGVRLSAKPFAVGVRIEHPQALIDAAQYGDFAGHPKLGPADYALIYQDRDSGRAVYSFCMCPGGQVVAAASEQGGIVVNGMSNCKRDSGIANSALVVTVGTADYGLQHPLAGIAYQRDCERRAYIAGGSNYCAPVQTVAGFLGLPRSEFLLAASYRPGSEHTSLCEVLPQPLVEPLRNALLQFNNKIKDFAHPGAVITAVETRTSSPCRIERNAQYQSVNVQGLYPIGEGAGYAGGIMSAACDGIRAALQYISEYHPN